MTYNSSSSIHPFDNEQARRDDATERVRCDCGARILNAASERVGTMSRMDYHLYHECPKLFDRSPREKREAIERWHSVLAAMPKPKKAPKASPCTRRPPAVPIAPPIATVPMASTIAPPLEKKAEQWQPFQVIMPVKYPLPITYPITTYAGQQICRVDDAGNRLWGPDEIRSDILF